MSFSAQHLRAVLEAQTPAGASGYVVAISGGADSACLLTALKELVPAPCGDLPVRALHVDHGLQSAAGDLRRAGEALCRRLQVPLTVVPVRVERAAGVSLEAAARDARYAGLARQFAAGECLLTAHHAEDQAQTLLLQLLRGAGLKGMAAMPRCRAFHGGWHLRPLLEVAQRELLEYGRHAGVTAVLDPMNLDLRFDRVYLRERLWPLLVARWPGAALTVSRTARHAADAQALLDQAAARAILPLRDGDSLSVTGLRSLDAAAQRNALRHWIAESAVAPPSTARLSEALRQILDSDEGQLPAVRWGAHALRRYRNRLFLTAARPPRLPEQCDWPVAAALELGAGLGRLRFAPQDGGLDAARLPHTLVVRRRRGGERLRPQRHARTMTLKHLCQSAGVLPWMRDALPLLYAGDELIAVGDLWQDARWCVAAGLPGVGCRWDGAPLLV
jgi:tRNA(Ile)-lysidine synthase